MSSRGRISRSDSGSSQLPRRQANACLRCYEKKVKCDMEKMGQPCTGCAAQGIECQRRSRKPYPQRKDTSSSISLSDSASINIALGPDRLPTPPRSMPSSEPMLTPNFASEPFDFSAPMMSAPNGLPNPLSVYNNTGLGHFHLSGEDTTISAAMPLFSDDHQGYGYMFDVCGSQRSTTAQSYLVPPPRTDFMDADAIAYAKAKGCYSLPSQQVCESLIYCYFHYVHTTLPVIDVTEFLEHYHETGFQNTSLLLLWSMFSVAANFIPEATLALTGSTSRQELKKILYDRAKCLYDLGFEQDKVTLIQSALLIGFWYSDPHDTTQSWHWTGVAISMAQAIGLHRNPDPTHCSKTITPQQRRLWANIWWSCFFRDRWLSFGYGRPLRIVSGDCDVPMPVAECMMEMSEHAPHAWRRFLPVETQQMASIWLGLLNLSVVLGDILAANYQPRRSPLDANSLDLLERRISECLPEKQINGAYSELLEFFECYALLHLEATIVALYRPFATDFITSHTVTPDPALCNLANMRTRAAATRASGNLDRIISTNTLRFAGPMMVPLLVPAMTIHLLQARSHDHFTSSWSRNRLELSLLVLKRLEDNYPAASLVYELFANARDNSQMPFNLGSSMSSQISVPDYHSNQPSWASASIDLGTPSGVSHHWPTPPSLSPCSDMKSDWMGLSPMEQVFFPLDDLSGAQTI